MPTIVSKGPGKCSLTLADPRTEIWCGEVGKPKMEVQRPSQPLHQG